MSKTIKQLADELKVSKQTIQYHYQRLPAKNRQKDRQGTNMISLTAERIIRAKVAKPLVAKNQQTGSKEETKTSKENNELVTTLRREIDDLKFQRDKQLATKDQQIEHLTKLIDQQQQLQLATLTENRQLKNHVQELSGLLEASSSIEKRQAAKKNDNFLNGANSRNTRNKNGNQDKNSIVDTDNKKKNIHKRWWRFWNTK